MYMAPEIVINSRRLKSASFESLKKVDVWAFGMVMFNLVNPNMKYPFQLDVAEDVSLIDQMPEILERKKCPRRATEFCMGSDYGIETKMHRLQSGFRPNSVKFEGRI